MIRTSELITAISITAPQNKYLGSGSRLYFGWLVMILMFKGDTLTLVVKVLLKLVLYFSIHFRKYIA